MCINQVAFSGNLGAAAKTGTTKNNKRWASAHMFLTLKSFKNEDGSWSNEQMRVSISAWEFLADKLAKFPKGSHVMVTGALRNKPIEYEDEELDETAPGYVSIDLQSIELIGQLPKNEEPSEAASTPKKRRVVKKAAAEPSEDDDIPFGV